MEKPYKIFYGNNTYKLVSDFDDGKKLPEGWVKAYSDNQNRYYYLNKNTNETQNEKPLSEQNRYSPYTYTLDLTKPSSSEVFEGYPHIRTSSGRYVNETPIVEDGRTFYRSRSGNKTYVDSLPSRPYGDTERIVIEERCCDGQKTQFPSRLCGESYSHTLVGNVSYIFNMSDKSLDGFVEIRNEKAEREFPKYESFDFIRKKDTVIGYRATAVQWLGLAPRVQDVDHNLSDHDAIILNLQFRTTQGDMPFNIISMNLEGLLL